MLKTPVFNRPALGKSLLRFRNPHCPILETALHRLQLRIISGPAGIRRLQSVLSGRTEIFLFGAPLVINQQIQFLIS